MTDNQTVIDSMRPLIKQAKRERLWLLSPYHDIWLTPEELEKHQEAGSFCWGPPNWQLRDPHDLLERKKQAISDANRDFERTRDRITKWEASR